MHKKFQLKSYSVVSYTYVKLLEKIQLTPQVLYGNPILYLSFELSLNIVLHALAKSPKLLITSKKQHSRMLVWFETACNTKRI